MPFKIWGVGEEVLASDFNPYVQAQVVAQFPNAAARDAQWIAPVRGSRCITTDTLTTWLHDGSTWLALPPMTGYLGTVSSTADATSSGTVVALPGSTMTIPLISNRRLRVDIHGSMSTPAATNVGRLSGNMDGSEVVRVQGSIVTAGSTTTTAEVRSGYTIIDSAPSGTRTFSMSVNRPQGAGSIIGHAGTRLTVTDLGPV